MWGKHVVVRLLFVAGVAMCTPAAASAADVAYVNSSGVVVVQGDNSTNQINFAEGASDPNTHYQYGAAIWDSAPGESITAGAGCITGDPEWSSTPGVVECAAFGPTAIQIDEGSGAGDTVTDHTGPWWPGSGCGCDGYFTSIRINAGNGGDTIHPLADNDMQGSTVVVNGGAGSDTIDPQSESTNASSITFNGGAGNDTIHGPVGCSCTVNLSGAAGNNTITAGDGGTVNITAGAGSNSITGGQGNDTINTYNGYRDTVDCEILGNDEVVADQYDVVNRTDCARVTVKQWGATHVALSLSVPQRQHPVKAKKILATVGCSAACYMGAAAKVKISGAKPFQISSTLYHLGGAGRSTIPIPFSRHQLRLLKSALQRHDRIVATIVAVLTNSTGSKLEGESAPRTLLIKN
jgi:hemolysin type calcium-binding protein